MIAIKPFSCWLPLTLRTKHAANALAAPPADVPERVYAVANLVSNYNPTKISARTVEPVHRQHRFWSVSIIDGREA